MKPLPIVIADDHAPLRQLIRSFLSCRAEYDVCGEAADGGEAISQARALHPDLILMDVSMPNVSGIDATRVIRAELPEIQVLLVSQNDPKVVARQASEVGARGWIAKSELHLQLLDQLDSLSRSREPDPSRLTSGQDDLSIQTIASREPVNLLASIVDSSDDAIVSKDLNGFITSWNKSAERIFGYSAAEAVGKHITLIIPKDRHPEEDRILKRLRKGEHVEHFQTIRLRKDGSLVDVSLSISPVHDASGTIVGASKVARDITEEKTAQERERRITAEAVASNAKFRAVFEQTTQFAGIMSKDGTLVDVNKLFLNCCGYSTDQVLRREFWNTAWWRHFPESQDKIREATSRVARGEQYREILRYSWAQDTERLVDFALFPILDDQGEVIFLHPAGVDITELKQNEENYRRLAQSLEAEVRARTAELEHRNAEVLRQSELVREFSHRFLRAQEEERRHIARELHDSAGQNLAVLAMSLAQLIQKAGRTAPELAKDAAKIQEAVHQLHAEIRTTSYLLHPPLLDEAGLASALNWYIQGLAERSGLNISLDIPDDFDRLPHELELAVFRLVQECLTNIHRHSGSQTAFISLARDPSQIIIEVRDEGKGISPERLSEIQASGAGVGIRGIRERLRQFCGVLNISSGPSGTRVLVTIPVPKAAESPSRGQSARAAV